VAESGKGFLFFISINPAKGQLNTPYDSVCLFFKLTLACVIKQSVRPVVGSQGVRSDHVVFCPMSRWGLFGAKKQMSKSASRTKRLPEGNPFRELNYAARQYEHQEGKIRFTSSSM